jgi:hypothetical protein
MARPAARAAFRNDGQTIGNKQCSHLSPEKCHWQKRVDKTEFLDEALVWFLYIRKHPYLARSICTKSEKIKNEISNVSYANSSVLRGRVCRECSHAKQQRRMIRREFGARGRSVSDVVSACNAHAPIIGEAAGLGVSSLPCAQENPHASMLE